MPESEVIVGAFITALVGFAGLMIRKWHTSWENRLIAVDKRLTEHDGRLSEHDVTNATLEANLENITKIANETRTDVKELLRNSNGNRSTG